MYLPSRGINLSRCSRINLLLTSSPSTTQHEHVTDISTKTNKNIALRQQYRGLIGTETLSNSKHLRKDIYKSVVNLFPQQAVTTPKYLVPYDDYTQLPTKFRQYSNLHCNSNSSIHAIEQCSSTVLHNSFLINNADELKKTNNNANKLTVYNKYHTKTPQRATDYNRNMILQLLNNDHYSRQDYKKYKYKKCANDAKYVKFYDIRSQSLRPFDIIHELEPKKKIISPYDLSSGINIINKNCVPINDQISCNILIDQSLNSTFDNQPIPKPVFNLFKSNGRCFTNRFLKNNKSKTVQKPIQRQIRSSSIQLQPDVRQEKKPDYNIMNNSCNIFQENAMESSFICEILYHLGIKNYIHLYSPRIPVQTKISDLHNLELLVQKSIPCYNNLSLNSPALGDYLQRKNYNSAHGQEQNNIDRKVVKQNTIRTKQIANECPTVPKCTSHVFMSSASNYLAQKSKVSSRPNLPELDFGSLISKYNKQVYSCSKGKLIKLFHSKSDNVKEKALERASTSTFNHTSEKCAKGNPKFLMPASNLLLQKIMTRKIHKTQSYGWKWFSSENSETTESLKTTQQQRNNKYRNKHFLCRRCYPKKALPNRIMKLKKHKYHKQRENESSSLFNYFTNLLKLKNEESAKKNEEPEIINTAESIQDKLKRKNISTSHPLLGPSRMHYGREPNDRVSVTRNKQSQHVKEATQGEEVNESMRALCINMSNTMQKIKDNILEEVSENKQKSNEINTKPGKPPENIKSMRPTLHAVQVENKENASNSKQKQVKVIVRISKHISKELLFNEMPPFGKLKVENIQNYTKEMCEALKQLIISSIKKECTNVITQLNVFSPLSRRSCNSLVTNEEYKKKKKLKIPDRYKKKDRYKAAEIERMIKKGTKMDKTKHPRF